MELSASPAAGALSRPTRLNRPKALALLAGLFCFALAALWLQTWPLVDGAGLTLTLVLAALVVWTWRSGSAGQGALLVVAAAAAAWRAWGFASAHSLLDARQPAVVGAALAAAAMAVTAMTAAVGRPSAARTLALALSIGVPLWVGNVAWTWLLPKRLISSALSVALVEDARYVDRGELGSRFAPHSQWIAVYPNNPRGYFECRSRWGKRDVRLFDLHVDETSAARLSTSDGPPPTARIEIERLSDERTEWQVRVQLWRLPVIAGETYEMRLRCRAQESRQAALFLNQSQPPFQSLASLESFELGPEWRELVWQFRAAQDSGKADLMLLLGQSTAAVELADLSVTPREGKLDMRGWMCDNAAASRATLEPYDPDRRSLRLHVRRALHSNKARVELTQSPLRLVGGVEYGLEFWGRADQSQNVNVSAYATAPQWQALGLQKTIRLDPVWQAYRLSFVANADSHSAAIGFMAGLKTGLVELADISLRCPDPGEHFLYPRFVVESQANSLGYRDREHAVEPAAGVFRIACLGDSHTMGQGVRSEDVFPVRLEQLLNEGHDPARYEVLNFGHSGYDTHQERLVYEREAATFQPQVVLVCMTENDDVSWLHEVQAGVHAPPNAAEKLLAPLGELKRRRQIRPERDFSVCARELETLHAACQANNARLAVVMAHHHNTELSKQLTAAIAPTMERLGVPVLDPGPEMEALNKSQDLNVHPLDGHPNEIAHRRLAELIADFLAREGLLSP